MALEAKQDNAPRSAGTLHRKGDYFASEAVSRERER